MKNNIVEILNKINFEIPEYAISEEEGVTKQDIISILYYLLGDCLFISQWIDPDAVVDGSDRVVVLKKGVEYYLQYNDSDQTLTLIPKWECQFHCGEEPPFSCDDRLFNLRISFGTKKISFICQSHTSTDFQEDSFEYGEKIPYTKVFIQYQRKIYDQKSLKQIERDDYNFTGPNLVRTENLKFLPDADRTIHYQVKYNYEECEYLPDFSVYDATLPDTEPIYLIKEKLKIGKNSLVNSFLQYAAVHLDPEELLKQTKQYHL